MKKRKTKIRLFIALNFPEKIKIALEEIQANLSKTVIEARWVKPKSSHLTLVFLGWTDPNQIKLIEPILEKVTGEIKPVKLSFNQLNCFPDPKKARVVFVDLGGELGKFHALAKKIRKGLIKEKIDFDPKPMVAHSTLGRLKKPQNVEKIIKEVNVEKVKFELNQVTLTKSQLTRAGSIYTHLKTFSL